jgi:hypothetical protein
MYMDILTRAFLCHITNCVSQTTAQRSYQLWINSFQNSEIYLESWMRLLRKGEPHVYISFSNLKLFRRTFVDKRIRLGSIDPSSPPISRRKAKELKMSFVVVNFSKYCRHGLSYTVYRHQNQSIC